jgi:addiction module RelB/DinJ family antitoxin
MKTLINIKADKEVKEGAQALAKELGLPLSIVVNAYLKDFIRNRGINISAVPRMSRQLETILGGVEKDIAVKKNISRAFSSAKDAGRYLDSL